jgi:hypothetical protein
MITFDSLSGALVAVSLVVGATIVLCCAYVAAYIVRQVRTWRRWDGDD